MKNDETMALELSTRAKKTRREVGGKEVLQD